MSPSPHSPSQLSRGPAPGGYRGATGEESTRASGPHTRPEPPLLTAVGEDRQDLPHGPPRACIRTPAHSGHAALGLGPRALISAAPTPPPPSSPPPPPPPLSCLGLPPPPPPPPSAQLGGGGRGRGGESTAARDWRRGQGPGWAEPEGRRGRGRGNNKGTGRGVYLLLEGRD